MNTTTGNIFDAVSISFPRVRLPNTSNETDNGTSKAQGSDEPFRSSGCEDSGTEQTRRALHLGPQMAKEEMF